MFLAFNFAFPLISQNGGVTLLADRTSSFSSLLAGGCSGHALAQTVELRDVVVGGSIDGRVKFITCRRRSSYIRQGHIPFYLFWFGWESFWLLKETNDCDFA
jgi:hypothetical protein